MTPYAMLEAGGCPPLSKYHVQLRNHWTFVANELAIQQTDILSRLEASHRSWSMIKTTFRVPVTFLLHGIVCRFLPLRAQQWIARNMQLNSTVVFSNVPGPQTAAYLAGSKLRSAHVFCPNLCPYVGVLSFNGLVHTAASLGDERDAPELLANAYLEEITEVAKTLCGMTQQELNQHIFAGDGRPPKRHKCGAREHWCHSHQRLSSIGEANEGRKSYMYFIMVLNYCCFFFFLCVCVCMGR